jgi:23S rRNA (uracil1939-C5)-methyltransferase
MRIRIEKAVYGGAGLSRLSTDSSAPESGEGIFAGKTVFTPYVLPGELIEAHITVDRRTYLNAEIDSVLEPSRERVVPGCEYFAACGGCQYQHANASYQLQMKLDILKDTLERAHLGSHLNSLTRIEGVSGPPWHYRNRIRLQTAQKDGQLILCYRERGSHKSLPVTHCAIAAPVVERAMTAVLNLGQKSGVASLCDEIELFTDGAENSLLISLWTSRHQRKSNPEIEDELTRLAESLKLHVPELAGIGLFSAGDRPERLVSHWGQHSIPYTVMGHEYRVSLGSFFQVNRFLLPHLLDLVVSGRSGRVAWDLYAGVGLFANALDFERVTAVESGPFSFSDLKHNLSGTRRHSVQLSTLDFLRGQLRRAASREAEARPDFILLDPPRTGLGREACTLLAQIAAPEIVYVSCDPATLARDLQALLQSGYQLSKLHLLDMFPQTFHLETVAALARN